MLYLKASSSLLQTTPTSKATKWNIRGFSHNPPPVLFSSICPSTGSVIIWPPPHHHCLPLSPHLPSHTQREAHTHTHTPHSSLSSPHCKSLYLFLASLGWLPTCRVAHAGLELQFFLPLLLKYCGWVPLTCSPLDSIKYTCLPSWPCFLVCIGNGKQRRHEWEKAKRPGWGNLASNETYGWWKWTTGGKGGFAHANRNIRKIRKCVRKWCYVAFWM